MKKIDELKNKIDKFPVVISQVDPMDFKFPHMVLTDYELLVSTIYKLNELIDVTNKYYTLVTEFIEWVTSDGLNNAVIERLNEWLVDGTLGDLVNDVLFNSKLDKEIYINYNTVNVKDFGAIGNGLTDDTNSIQNAVNFISACGGGTVFVPNGMYLIKAEDEDNTLPHLWDTGGIIMKNNVTLHLQEGAIFKAIKSTQGIYHVITLYNVSNIKIIGGSLYGERKEHDGILGEFGFGINIAGECNNIFISDMYIKDMWGDAININNRVTTRNLVPSNITIKNVVADNNRRQGLSINSGKNIIIEGSTFKNTNGTLPMNGIDIEPWHDNGICENIVIRDCQMIDNQKEGLTISSADFTSNIKNILIDNCVIKGNESELAQVHVYNNNKNVKFTNCLIENATGEFAVQNTGGFTRFENCEILGGGLVSRELNGAGSLTFVNGKIDSYLKSLLFNDTNLEIFNSTIYNGKVCPLNEGLTMKNNKLVDVGGYLVLGYVVFENNIVEKNTEILFYMADVGYLLCNSNTFKNYLSNLVYLTEGNVVFNNNTIIPSSLSPRQALTGITIKNLFMRNNTLINKTGKTVLLIEAIMDASCNSDYATYNKSDYGMQSQIIYEISTGKTLVCSTSYSYTAEGVLIPATWGEIGV